MEASFSSNRRTDMLRKMAEEEQDLLVIGGGITGAGILLDAAARGVQSSLVEMQDFAAGTSNRSTKLVHGGLRYLKQFEIGLVADVGKERAIVYENGPHVTTPLWMLLPIVEGGTFGRLGTAFGIWLYDRLAAVKPQERRQMLNRKQTLEAEPLFKREGLKGGAHYVEYRTDDARLTLEIIKEAAARDALAANYVRAETFLYDSNGKLAGVTVRDMISGVAFNIKAKQVVNATGPWVDGLREWDRSKQGKTLHWTKGVHIVVDGAPFPLQNPVYFDVPDGRMIFAVPREGKVYIGTTDTDFDEDLEHPRMTRADRDYLLAAVNGMFPTIGLKETDVESSWAGVRPLIHEEGKAPSEISRKDEIFYSDSGLITIAGGKLTGYRKMAERVVDSVCERLSTQFGQNYPSCSTESIEISGGKFGGSQHFAEFIEKRVQYGARLGLSEEEALELAHRYGTNVDLVFSNLEDLQGIDMPQSMPRDVYAALCYGLEHEMVLTPSDFFIRRTGSLYFDIQSVHQWKDAVIDFMRDYFGWSEAATGSYRRELEERIIEAVEVA